MHDQGRLHLQHEIASSFASSLGRTPPPPECLGRLAADLAHGILAVAGTPAGRSCLEEVRMALFMAPGREREALSLWHQSLATAAHAGLICGISGASVATASFGGLLHRIGDAWLLHALAGSESKSDGRLDSMSRMRFSALESQACVARLARDWNLPAPVAACIRDWRRCAELEPVSQEATAVYCGRLLALELLEPRFCVPGSVASALAEHGFDGSSLVRLRSAHLRVLRLTRSLD